MLCTYIESKATARQSSSYTIYSTNRNNDEVINTYSVTLRLRFDQLAFFRLSEPTIHILVLYIHILHYRTFHGQSLQLPHMFVHRHRSDFNREMYDVSIYIYTYIYSVYCTNTINTSTIYWYKQYQHYILQYICTVHIVG